MITATWRARSPRRTRSSRLTCGARPRSGSRGSGWSATTSARSRRRSPPRRFLDRSRPGVPALRLHPGAEPRAVALAVRLPGVPERESVDVAEVDVLFDRDDRSHERDVVVPVAVLEHGERHVRVRAEVAEAHARVLHVQEYASVLPVVPGGRRVRRAVGPYGADDSGMRLREERGNLLRDGDARHDANPTGSEPCLLYTSPSPRDGLLSRMPSSA